MDADVVLLQEVCKLLRVVGLLTRKGPCPLRLLALLAAASGEALHGWQTQASKLLPAGVKDSHSSLVDDVGGRDSGRRWRVQLLLLVPIRLHLHQVLLKIHIQVELLLKTCGNNILPMSTLWNNLRQLLVAWPCPSIGHDLHAHGQQPVHARAVLGTQTDAYQLQAPLQHARFVNQTRLLFFMNFSSELGQSLCLTLPKLRDIDAERCQPPGKHLIGRVDV
mmetsp:Transcript_16777/g.46176  ORF Transcript_16777/g.46176 Transcript_16777/m.46176 type:complete len:221 (+) Transcript_16777:2537-3199(+)